MKRITIFLTIVSMMMCFCSCRIVKQIGDVNMISERNIDSKFDYQRLTTYSGASKWQLKHSEAKNLQQAVAKTVKEVPGGEFIMNAKAYVIYRPYATKKNRWRYAVEGDVWGHLMEGGDYQGWHLGDRVMYHKWFKNRYGTIIAIKNSQECIIKCANGYRRKIKFDRLMRTFKEN